MTQYLIRSRHRAVRGWSYALQDRPHKPHSTLDLDVAVFEVNDGLSLREAINQHRSFLIQELADQMGPETWTNC